MAVEAITWPGAPTATDADDAESYVMGVSFNVSQSVECAGIRWRTPDDVSEPPDGGTYFISLWDSVARVKHQAIVPVGGGDEDFLWAVPTTLDPADNPFTVQVFTRHYTFRSGGGGFPFSTPSGFVSALNGELTAGGGPDVKASSNFDSIYFVSPLIGTVDEEPGDLELTVNLALPALDLAATLTNTDPRELTADLALPALSLTVAMDVETDGVQPAHGFPLRAQLAEVLSTVTGLNGYIRRPPAAKVGDAWPKMTGLEHVSPGTWQVGWQIVVLLPQDDLRQDDWIIARLDEMTDALAPYVWIESMEIGTSADAPALLINCRE